MSLVSTGFFVFLFVGVVIYYVIPKKMQWAWLLILSYAYYLYAGKRTAVFIVAATCITYATGLMLSKADVRLKEALAADGLAKDDKKAIKKRTTGRKKLIVVAAVLLVFGILACIKYGNFIASGRSTSLISVLGISFFSFQSVGYVIDVYRGKTPACVNIFKYALFVSYFPQITQGPIGRFDRLAPQFFKGYKYDLVTIQHGLQLMAWGLFKKFVVADRAGVAASLVFNNPGQYHGVYVMIGVLAYSAQLYGDFAGGIDLVMGASELFGIKLDDNFRQPFFSHSISEFWRRWHITLGTWMKDYVFYPFSLSRPVTWMSKRLKAHSESRLGKYLAKALPICLGDLLVFFIVGVWHGAAWKYIVYGMYNGVIMAFSSLMSPVYDKMFKITHINKKWRLYRLWQIVRTFILVNISFYFDNASSLGKALVLMKNTLIGSAWNIQNIYCMFGSEEEFKVFLIACVVWLVVSIFKEKGVAVRDALDRKPLVVRWTAYVFLTVSVAVFGYVSTASCGFMYASF